MKWLLLLLFIPTVSALRIAASPDSMQLDANGEGTLRLFNPNEESVDYVISGVWEQEGVLDAGTSEVMQIVNDDFYGDSLLDIQFRSSKGSDKISVRSGLKIPVSRIRPAVPVGNQIVMFSIIFLASLFALGLGYFITTFL